MKANQIVAYFKFVSSAFIKTLLGILSTEKNQANEKGLQVLQSPDNLCRCALIWKQFLSTPSAIRNVW